MDKLEEKALQVFKENYGVKPSQEGFIITRKIGHKVVYAKNEEAVSAYTEKRKGKKKMVIIAVVYTIIALILFPGLIMVLDLQEDKSKFYIAFFAIVFLKLLVSELKHQDRRREELKERIKGNVIIYSFLSKKFVEL